MGGAVAVALFGAPFRVNANTLEPPTAEWKALGEADTRDPGEKGPQGDLVGPGADSQVVPEFGGSNAVGDP